MYKLSCATHHFRRSDTTLKLIRVIGNYLLHHLIVVTIGKLTLDVSGSVVVLLIGYSILDRVVIIWNHLSNTYGVSS